MNAASHLLVFVVSVVASEGVDSVVSDVATAALSPGSEGFSLTHGW